MSFEKLISMSLTRPSRSTPAGGLVMYRLPHYAHVSKLDTIAGREDPGFVATLRTGVYGEAQRRAQHHLGRT